MGRRIIAIAAALLLAVAGTALVFIYARGADQRAVSGQQPREVYVTTALVPSGTTLKDAERSKLIEKTTVATKGLPAGALARVDGANSSLVSLNDMAPGQYVLADAFGTTPVGSKAIQVPAGMMAISVELADPARVGRFVTPGSYITIFDTYGLKRIGTDEATKQFNEMDFSATSVLLDKVLVIGMGEASLTPEASSTTTSEEEEEKDTSDQPSFLVTVAVKPELGPRLVHGINSYRLYAGLHGSDVTVDPKSSASDLTVHP